MTDKKEKYNWDCDFDGSSLPDIIWHVGELWWFGQARIFYHNCEVDYRKEDATSFWMEGMRTGKKGGFFGARFPWCSKEFHGSRFHRPSYYLENKYIYKFIIGMDEQPDYVLVNQKIVWEKGNGKYENRYLEFTYHPESPREEIEIDILNTLRTDTHSKLLFSRSPYFERPKMKCWRTPRDISKKAASYKKFKFPDDTNFITIDNEIASKRLEKYNSFPIDYDIAECPVVPYETSKMQFFIKDFIGRNLKKCGIDIFDLSPNMLKLEKAALLIEKIKKSGLDIMFFPCINDGNDKYNGENWIHFLKPGKLEEAKSGTCDLINECCEINPSSNIYLMYPEFIPVFGYWNGGIEYSPMKSLPQLKAVIEKGGTDAYMSICDYWQKLTNDIKNTVRPNKVKVIGLYMGGMHAALMAKAGADILMNKHIHRRNQNIVVANTRGTADAYGMEYGFDNDCWNRNYVCDYTPEEVRQNMKVYYFSGGEYLYYEGIYTYGGQLTEIGREYIEFARYVKCHPALGKQKVKIAIIRGLPDEWDRFAAPSSGWEAAKDGHEVTSHKYFEDYNLLNLVFPNYGLFYRTFPDRLCTGTPYGPVDFVPWDAPEDKLKQYEVVIYLGKSECMTPEIFKNLKNYVTSGGTLFAALGQFKDKKGEIFKKDLSDFLGAKYEGDFTLKEDPEWDKNGSKAWTLPSGKIKYHVMKASGKNSRTVYRFKNSDPYVIENISGKGKVFLFAADYMTEFDSFTPARLIQPELEKAKWLEFSPSSDWLEYMVQKKGDCYILPIFNHGNVGFPSGNGRKTGPWNGKVTLDLDRFEFPKGKLTVYESIYVPDEKIPYKLVKIDSVQENNRLSFNVKIDKFSEIVIGPSGKVKNTYFAKKQ